jgi:hypothetical protein
VPVLNSPMNDSDHGDLCFKLRSWKIELQETGSFEREVWKRVAARRRVREEAFRGKLIRWFAADFEQSLGVDEPAHQDE